MWLSIPCCPFPRSANIPMKECLAYGEVKRPQQADQVNGEGEEEEVHIYAVADLQQPGGEDDGDYEN